MTPNEKFYDEVIAPQLLQLCQACKQKGISFFAQVEYARDEYSRTSFLADDAGIGQRLVLMASLAKGNFDVLTVSALDHAKRHGSGSFVLSSLVEARP